MIKYSILFLSIILSTFVQASDNMVVIESNTEFYQVGQLLDSQFSVKLPDQTHLTVVFATGGVQTVTGPYQDKLTDPLSHHPSDPLLVTTLATYLKDDGLVRRSAPSRFSKNVWVVDVTDNKRNYCVTPSNRVTLWRPENLSENAGSLLIKHKSSGEQAQETWPARQTTLGWPSHLLPIHFGDTYTVELKNHQSGPSFKKLVLYQVPDDLPTESHKVVWMIGRGCIPQANKLLASLR